MKGNFLNQITGIALLLLIAISCKKNPIENGESIPTEPIQTARGTIVGTTVTKSIGATGGELISGDGKLKVMVPQGSVSTTTQFSIEPITNTLFEDGSRIAYRLLPEGITFNMPVTLQFSYDGSALTNTVEDFLSVASQQANGSWRLEPTVLNKTMKTLTVETSHFSDWTVTGGFELRVQKHHLRPGQKSTLSVVTATDDLLAYLTVSSEDEASLTALGNWQIIQGPGSLESFRSGTKGFAKSAEYTAPSSVTGIAIVVITMEVEGFNRIKDPSAPGGIRQTGKMILYGRITVSENFLTGTLDGVEFGFFGNNIVATGLGGLITIRASDASGEVTVSANATAAGSYPGGQIIFPGKSGVSIGAPTGGPFYVHSYFECGQTGELKFSPGVVELKKWPAIGQPAEGSFSGPVYLNNGLCGPETKYLYLNFNVTRSN
jgi:hypothetical protein